MSRIKIIIKRPIDEVGGLVYIENSLENLQGIVNGYIEAIPIRDDTVIICNSDGKIRDMLFNFRLPWDDYIAGTAMVCGVSGDEFADVPITLDEWRQMLDEWKVNTRRDCNV